jgi:branched-chain amino acid transport system ATP-binding protein
MKANLAGIRTAIMPRRRRQRSTDDTRLLEVSNVSKSFSVLAVLKKVSFSVGRGNILVMIGPNGAGKSTLLKIISGLLPITEGEIWFKGQKISGMAPHQIASLGISQLFQDIQLFRNMTVIENVMAGCHLQAKTDFMSSGLRLARAKVDEQSIFEAAMKQLSLVGLREKAFSHPGSLSWGQQKLAGLARALATGSELLLLDEPYSGLLADEVDKLNQLIFELQSQGMTILIVEHLTDILMGIASQVIVLDYGEKIAEGTPIEIQKNKRVIDAYLGGEQLEDEGS